MKRLHERRASMLGIVGQENNSTERLRFALGFNEKDDGTICIPNKRPRHVSEEGPEDHFLLQRAGDEQIDFVRFGRVENRHRCIFPFLVMNCRIFGEREREQSIGKFFRGLVIAGSDIDEMQLPAKPIPNALGFREHLAKPWRKRARDGDGAIRRLDHFRRSIVRALALLGN